MEDKSEVIVEKKPKKERGLYYTKKEPKKSFSVYLRNQNKFIITSLSIADRKAMIMIRINSTLVSALIVFHDYIADYVQQGGTIASILIVGNVLSLICSIIAAKPNGWQIHTIFKKDIDPKYPNLEENNFMIFRNLCSFDDYEKSMDKVVNSQELQIGNQVRANYVLMKYIVSKYLLLDLAYGLFLLSFISVVAVFFGGSFFM